MRLILVRHGETVHNAANMVQGQAEGRLSAKGERQAKAASARLQDIGIDAIYSSDLGRARETAKIAASHFPGLSISEDPRVREQNFGIFEDRPIVELLREMDSEESDFATFIPAGGESRADFHQRVLEFFLELRERHAGQTVLLVTHYGVINLLLGSLLNHDDPLSTDWQIANGSVTILEVGDDEQVYPRALNDIAHLEETFLEPPE
jgi:2,3-bisphosphoglycerate-dependent phosphoglycerate mutase